MRAACTLAVVFLALPGSAAASIWIANDARAPALRVDGRGNAEVSWSAGSARRSLLVPQRGRVLPGAHIAGADVSRPAGAASLHLPVVRVLRRTRDGRYWVLQAWQPAPGGPVELHFSRWRGKPTELTLELACCKIQREFLHGEATFQGRPVHGFSSTPAGKRLRISAYLDCFACSGRSGWTKMNGVAPSRNGSFSLLIRQQWRGSRYRATIADPNLGTTLAPDARAVLAAPPLPEH